MNAKQLKTALTFAIGNQYPLLIKGAPGVGKTAIVEQACKETNTALIISHPVVSDPTDYKGLPFPEKDENKATFLPFGDLLHLIEAKRPTVFFLDDLGQATPSVQAACMQLLLARRINGHKVSEKVTFLAATNRRQDKAGVQGILEPVKSRFVSILDLEVNVDDWIEWAWQEEMPIELLAFIRFRPKLLHDFKPTNDMINTPNPRTVAHVGKMVKAGIPAESQYEMIAGAAGEGFAIEFMSFLIMYENLPDIDALISDPKPIAQEPSILFAVSEALVKKANRKNMEKILKCIDYMPPEFQVLVMKDAVRKNKALAQTKAFADWAIQHSDVIL